MAERRSLLEGIQPQASTVDSRLEREFVFGGSAAKAETAPVSRDAPRSPISTRIRSDFAYALKKVSLERQLRNETPFTVQQILEEALENWLRSNNCI